MSVYTFPIDNHIVLFQPVNKRLFILNPTAAWIWKVVVDGLQPSEIITLLTQHFYISTEDAERDVHSLLNQWSAYGLEPTQPKEETDQLVTPELTHICNRKMPADAQIAFQKKYCYGQCVFTLTDYTPDLESYLSPLLANLQQSDNGNATNRIDIFKDSDEYVVVSDHIELERTPLELLALGRTIQTMVEFGYPHTAWRSFIHASAGSLDGHGIIFPGIGGSGKSTLMAALVKSNWTYWCDDTVPLDIHGRVGPIPLCSCIKSGSWDVLASYYEDLEKFPVVNRCGKDVRYLTLSQDLIHFSETQPVHSLVFPLYTQDKPQKLQPISPVEGLQRLVEAQSWISPDPAHAEAMIHWISTIPIYTLNYSSLDWAISQLKRIALHN